MAGALFGSAVSSEEGKGKKPVGRGPLAEVEFWRLRKIERENGYLTREQQDELTRIEIQMNEEMMKYTAFGGDTRKPAAADYEDNYGSFQLHYCCLHNDVENGTGICGRYMSGRLWWKPYPELWRFYCATDWSQLPPDDPLYKAMAKATGLDHNGGTIPFGSKEWILDDAYKRDQQHLFANAFESNWPNLGCNCRFRRARCGCPA